MSHYRLNTVMPGAAIFLFRFRPGNFASEHPRMDATATPEPPAIARHTATALLTMPESALRLGVSLDRFRLLLTRHRDRVSGLLVQVGHLRCVPVERLAELAAALGIEPGEAE